ncbi:hypothetical protein QL285_065826 [Trifolium repens]|nr:hypothetical protein QL285_065826 [Trifolium repens]
MLISIPLSHASSLLQLCFSSPYSFSLSCSISLSHCFSFSLSRAASLSLPCHRKIEGSKKISSLFDLACLKSSMKLDLWMSQKNTCCDISSFASAKAVDKPTKPAEKQQQGYKLPQKKKNNRPAPTTTRKRCSDGGGVFGAVGGVPVVFGSGPNTGFIFSLFVLFCWVSDLRDLKLCCKTFICIQCKDETVLGKHNNESCCIAASLYLKAYYNFPYLNDALEV